MNEVSRNYFATISVRESSGKCRFRNYRNAIGSSAIIDDGTILSIEANLLNIEIDIEKLLRTVFCSVRFLF